MVEHGVRVLVRLVALLTAVGMLASCASIPTSGRINAAGEVNPADPPGYIDVNAARPREGADERGIVVGYLRAMSSYVPGFEVARSYLAADDASSWSSDAGITIYRESQPRIRTTDTGRVEMTFTVQGHVDAAGSYRPATEETEQRLELDLIRQNDQWRILDPPDGLLMSAVDFSRQYRVFDRFYFTPDFDLVVPDPVYLPINSSIATLLTQSLLTGPSPALAAGVRTAFPPTSALAVSSVRISEGTAFVELNEATTREGPDQRRRMLAQLVWTLSSIPEVRSVTATVGNEPLSPGIPEEAEVSEFTTLNPAQLPSAAPLLALGRSGVVLPTEDGVAVPGPAGALADLTDVALDLSATQVAAVRGGTEIVVTGLGREPRPRAIYEGPAIASPSWDRAGRIWAVEGGNRVISVFPEGEVVSVELGQGGSPGQIAALAVSPDGSRLAVIVDGRVLVGGIAVGAAGRGLSVPVLLDITPEQASGIDLAWRGSEEVAAIIREADGSLTPAELNVGGSEPDLRQPLEGAVSIAAASGVPIVVGTASGQLLRMDSTGVWQPIANARRPAYPG